MALTFGQPSNFDSMERLRTLRILAAGLLMTISSAMLAQTSKLEKINILGKEYYCYTASEGESLYGVSKATGWDQALISSMNPELSSPLKDGQRIIYPVGEKTVATHGDTEHLIAKGETVYSISRRYNVTPEDIYKANPGAEYGIMEGAVLVIPGKSEEISPAHVMHKIQHGETLYGVAKRYNTRVEDIMRENPGINDHNFQAGITIKVTPDSRKKNLIREQVQETQLLSVNVYKVKKNDTWDKISKKFNVAERMLREANPGVNELCRNESIIIPNAVTVSVTRDVPEVDPRESSPEGRREIFEEVKQEAAEKAVAAKVKIAVLLDDINSNKDIEFIRGFLFGVDQIKHSPYKISVKAIDGAGAGVFAIMEDLDSFKPNIIITTSDKEFPEEIADYARENGCAVLNVFDTKDDTYLENPSVVQILPPTSIFNKNVEDFVAERFGGRTLVIAGEAEADDGIATAVMNALSAKNAISVAEKDLDETEFDVTGDYFIYATTTRKADTRVLLEKVASLKEKYPGAEFAVLGRPSWITFSTDLKDLFCRTGVYFPSRFYFDFEVSGGKNYIESFKDFYKRPPIKSYPVYSVAGYDLARYFVPAVHDAAGDFTKITDIKISFEPLQTDVNLVKASPDGGYVNNASYMLKFNTFGNIDKILLTK